MKINRRPKFIRLWLLGTLVLLLGIGLVLRPDRDAAHFLSLQHIEFDESAIQTRQLVTHISVLRDQGLPLDQIKEKVLGGIAFTDEYVNRMIEHDTTLRAKAQAADRLTLFASIALLPPLLVLELGAALFWARRGLRAWMNASRMGVLGPVSHFLRQLRPT